MNAKALIPLVAGLGIGGIALKLGVNTLQQARAGQRTAKVAVWAARDDIPRGSAISEEMLTQMPFPADLAPQGAFTEKEKLIGRMPRLVAPAGLPVLESMLAPPDCPPGLNPPAGFRAVAVTIDAGSGVDYHLEPGAFVDVVGSFRMRNETIAKTVVENAEIAAVGPRVSPTTGKVADGKERVQTVRAVTLYVRPEEVKKILLVEQQGRIKLSLRGAEDAAAAADDSVVSDRELLGLVEEQPANAEHKPSDALAFLGALFASVKARAAAPTPMQEPDRRWVMRIHRGDQAETLQFKDRDSLERVDSGPAAGDGPNPRSEHTPAARSAKPGVDSQPPPEAEPEPEEPQE